MGSINTASPLRLLGRSPLVSAAAYKRWQGHAHNMLPIARSSTEAHLGSACRTLCHHQDPRWFSSVSNGAGSSRSAARRDRAKSMAAKRAQLEALLRLHESERGNDKHDSRDAEEGRYKQLQIAAQNRSEERDQLLNEAGFLVRSLYRTCLRSVRVIRPGNEHDEADFKEREEKQKREMEMEDIDLSESGSFSFTPPVDRENELRSRAEYYTEQIREGFGQEIDRLDSEPWRENEVSQFVYLVRAGEDQRKYILEDYRFKDPYADRFDQERLDLFKERAGKLIRDEYDARGWVLQSERDKNIESEHDTCEVFGEDEDYPA